MVDISTSPDLSTEGGNRKRSRIPLLLGSATFGEVGKFATRIHDLSECQKALDIFAYEHGYNEIDVARVYGNGTSEEYLSRLRVHGARIDTKCAPYNEGHRAAKLRSSLETSISTLGEHKIRNFYLHAPDKVTPLEETLGEVNNLYKLGLFESFGISNYGPDDVKRIYDICQQHGYILPSVYQGPYSLLSRKCETTLFPLLRELNMRFTAYSPLAGGMLAGSLTSKTDPGAPGGRFDESTDLGRMFRNAFTKGNEFEALEIISKAGASVGLTTQEIALRWLQHHSQLLPSDGVVIGFSSLDHLRSNIADCEKGPLPDSVLEAIEQAHQVLGS